MTQRNVLMKKLKKEKQRGLAARLSGASEREKEGGKETAAQRRDAKHKRFVLGRFRVSALLSLSLSLTVRLS